MENTLDVRMEMEQMELEDKKNGFVQMQYSAEDAFVRMQAVKEALAIVQNAINSTGGIMPIKTREAYEIFYGAAEAIKTYERDIVRDGR